MSYRIILADPPWHYNNRRATRRDNPSKKPKAGIGASGKYRRGVMSFTDLCAMGPLVQAVAAPDALLFCWVTCPRLDCGIGLYKAWGFQWATVAFVWEKLYPNGQTFRGMGAYTPSNAEFLLVGRRANLWHPNTGWKPPQVVRTPHPRDPETRKLIHSRKPEIFQDHLRDWLGPHIGDGGMLELFATRQRIGWTCLGDELTGTDVRDDLAAMAADRAA